MLQPAILRRTALAVMGGISVALGILAWSWYFTVNRLNVAAKTFGIYQSPTEAMMTQIDTYWIGVEEAWIRDVGPETFLMDGSHVWFVTACVWAESRADGSAVGSATHDFDFPGGYFVETRDGWVALSEDSALFVGYWMKIFGLAGDGVGQVITEQPSKPVCIRRAG